MGALYRLYYMLIAVTREQQMAQLNKGTKKKSIRKLNAFGSILESAIQFERISFEQNGRR